MHPTHVSSYGTFGARGVTLKGWSRVEKSREELHVCDWTKERLPAVKLDMVWVDW